MTVDRWTVGTAEAALTQAIAERDEERRQRQALEHELRAVDDALRTERVPLYRDATLTRMTRMGRIRWLGDQRRKAEQR